jgi:hypothetical protein
LLGRLSSGWDLPGRSLLTRLARRLNRWSGSRLWLARRLSRWSGSRLWLARRTASSRRSGRSLLGWFLTLSLPWLRRRGGRSFAGSLARVAARARDERPKEGVAGVTSAREQDDGRYRNQDFFQSSTGITTPSAWSRRDSSHPYPRGGFRFRLVDQQTGCISALERWWWWWFFKGRWQE